MDRRNDTIDEGKDVWVAPALLRSVGATSYHSLLMANALPEGDFRYLSKAKA